MKINPAEWSGLDWILLAIVAFSTVRAVMRGLISALFGLLGVVGGFQLASWNYVGVGNWLYTRQMISSLSTARITAFIVLAVAIVVFFELVGRGVKRTAHAVGLGMIDRVLGGSFGLLRGVLMGVILIVGLQTFTPQSTWVQGSHLSRYFLAAPHAVSFVVPHDLR